MKNSVLYIVGAVALLGGGAFLFLRNKKLKDASKLAEIEKATQVALSPPASATSTETQLAPVVKSATEIQADGLATQIFGLKTQKIALATQMKPISKGSIFGSSSNISNLTTQAKINALTSKINSLTNQLKALGYKEVDGKAVKL